MSYTNEKQATHAAFELKRKMKTEGWEVRVHQNIGWHFSLQNLDGHLSLFESEHSPETPYWTLFSITGKGVGDPHLTDDFRSNDPNKAVAHQMEIVERHFRQMEKLHEQFNSLKAQLK